MSAILKKTTVLFLGLTISGIASAQVIDPSLDPHIESHVKALLKIINSGNGKPVEQLTPKAARATLTDAQSSEKVDLSGIKVTQRSITENGLRVRITIVKPEKATAITPGFMFFHGGGWVLGDFPTHERLVRDLVVTSGATAIFVNYTPSPEAHYPLPINEAYAATKWVAVHGKEIGVDGNRLAVAGNSAGGNMAAVVALMAKDKHGPALKLQVLLWPVTDASFSQASYARFATGRFLSRTTMMYFWDSYLPEKAKRREIYASPLQATKAQLTGLPPAIVEVAENDVLRDEGEAYARKLDEAGVRVVSVCYNGMIHDFGLLNGLATVPATRAALTQAGLELKKALFQ
ncbi:alpha/beta hydrolase [Mucilaginibacter sp. BJC16-A38]|uniref:alpha/beta hydrolase n=1 Tax=Mucilaginibacter phenanthrenivorans TaxID=1234842 RepID=UPI0021581588|nr:alpha/beta hydrolase [Mucilaginibacter phenanthrenivorans]MCR8560348.1 alpha/beta hydrolase [Mucilaginibacter phenanthrenivorans]